MSVLITGGMGFIGLHATKAFVDAGEDVVITWYQTWREPSFIKDEYNRRVTVEKADVSEPGVIGELAKKHKVDSILHLAVPGVAALSPTGDYTVNMEGLLGVLQAAEQNQVRRLSIASSVAVYHSLASGPWTESDLVPLSSTNPTEAYKKSWEILGGHYASRAGLDVVMLRIGGIYGPLYHSLMNLPSRLVHAAAKDEAPDYAERKGGVPFEEDNGDFCYVKDCAEGIRLVHMAESLEHRAYNIGSGEKVTHGQLTRAALNINPKAQLKVNPGQGPNHRKNAFMGIGRVSQELGFKPAFSPEDALADYADWLRQGNEK